MLVANHVLEVNLHVWQSKVEDFHHLKTVKQPRLHVAHPCFTWIGVVYNFSISQLIDFYNEKQHPSKISVATDLNG